MSTPIKPKNTFPVILVAILSLVIGLPGLGYSVDEKKKETKQPTIKLPKFKTPPGKAKRKGTAGTRSGEDPVRVTLLTPETHGVTFSAQPAFFWHQSDSAKPKQIVFLIGEEGSDKNLVKVPINKSYPKGINRLDLATLKVHLVEGKSYKWSVSYVTNRKAPSLSGVGKGMIRFTKPSAAQATAIKEASAPQRAALYAENGAWHDLFATLDGLIKTDPKNAELRAERDKLLDQIGLGGKLK